MASCPLPALTERYQERAAVREYDGGLFRHEAELAALTDLVPHVPVPFDAEIWNTLAARGPVKGADKRVWAARILDQLERHTGLSSRISWPLFLRLERLEKLRQASRGAVQGDGSRRLRSLGHPGTLRVHP